MSISYNHKRFHNELDVIFNYYKSKGAPVFELDVKYKEQTIEVYLPENITIVLPKNYPFNHPDILICGKSYKQKLQSPSPRISSYLKKNKMDCLCCSVITCENKWSPIYSIVKVLDEMEKTKRIKKKIGYEICLDEITEKNRLPEIMADEILLYL